MAVLLIVFAAIVVVLILVAIYRSTLEIHEEDRLFIDAVAQSMANEQSHLIARIERLSRLIRVLCLLSGALFVVIAGLWIWQTIKAF